MLGVDSQLSGETNKEVRHKRPEKHSNCSLVRNISVSSLMIISRRRRRKEVINYRQELISVKCHNPEFTVVNTGTGRNPKRVCSFVHVERNKEPVRLHHKTDSLKVHRCIGTHSLRKTRMKTEPTCRATAMGTRKLEKDE